jgi:dienelactone hydrolase
MCHAFSVLVALVTVGFAATDGMSRRTTETGTVSFVPPVDQRNIPERYRLKAHEFDYEMRRKQELPISGVDVFTVRFPSPVQSPYPENNTVYAEYYRPATGGHVKAPFPCVVVLDITGGDQKLSRVIARHLAQNGIGGLFVQMAYYGPRRSAGTSKRLLSYDLAHTFEAIRQTVLDLRRAAAWMAARPEIDKNNLGIMGTSLGSFMAALTAEMEPRYGRVAVLLGGGGFVDAYYEHPQAIPFVRVFEALGGNKEMAARFIAPVDPLTCAENLKDRKLLIVAAKSDEIVPPRMAKNLWNASGRQHIVWLNAGHYSAVLYLVSGLSLVVEHFKVEAKEVADKD